MTGYNFTKVAVTHPCVSTDSISYHIRISIYICMYACVSVYAHTEIYKYEICVYMSNIYVMHICKLRGRKDKSLASQKK